MLILFFVLPIIIMIPSAVYFCQVIRRISTLFLNEETKKSKIICGVCGGLVMLLSWPAYGFRGMIILHLLGFFILFDFINLFVQRIFFHKKNQIWNFLYKSGIPVFLVTAMLMGYGVWNMNHVEEKDYTVHTKELKKENLEIALISDLHLETTMDSREMKVYVNQIEKKKPDMVLLAGDIVDENTTRDEMKRIARVFGAMKSTYGTYYVFGNHDYNSYGDHPNYTAEELEYTFEKEGIHVLADEIVKLGDEITLVGQRDASDFNRKDMSNEIKAIDPNQFVIYMDHQPGDIKKNAAMGIDLQVSGHTHAGQIFPMGQVMELFGVNQINYGHRTIGNYQVIVSSGIAGWGYPIRTGGRCEYVMIKVV